MSEAMTDTQTTQTDWPIAFFDDDYLKIYAPRLTAERTQAEVAFIEHQLGLDPKERELALAPGARVLDLACGAGRHAVGMAKRGHRVTGFDFNASYLELGAKAAREAGTTVTWVQGDMREFRFEQPFQAAYSYFTSFGYYSDDENERVLTNIARALEPGGRFLIEVTNRDYLLTHPLQRSWLQRDDGALLMEENTIDLVSSRVTTRQTLIEPGAGSRITKEYVLRVYTCAELAALMRRHGLEVTRALGGIDGAEFGRDSHRLVLVATRRGG
jgi:ubiquinone/menaquinone biosynthesis C-methylase UbiE